MANKANNFFKRTKEISQALKDISERIKKTDNDIKEIAEKGKQKAQETLETALSDNDFTQKAGNRLVKEIGTIQISKNEYRVVAPISGNVDIPYTVEHRHQIEQHSYNLPLQMYFAEYGAGLALKENKVAYTRLSSGYTPKNRYKTGWAYEDLQGKYHFVNTSKAVGYMKSARQEMRQELKNLSKDLKAQFRTRIMRNK